ncbi:hypothetical protein M426DRAFT_234161 [Hypoxylon sp. CI-4A]|nr:hypothetical protein M426DRAFT_234161 [Hypoxylon sp. CI-4A]
MARINQYRQEPVAIVGFGCRLPGSNSSPQKLWDFLERGDIASSAVPKTRFNIEGHHDGSRKPKTMRQPGGMFLDNIDLSAFDAGFFEISRSEAVSMDPNQRQLLEVVFEGLESAGMTLENIDEQPIGCFVGSYASDYADMHNRDPEDRPGNNAVGVARALLANRLSHFLNVKGPSITLDTACSGSIQGLEVACRYLQSREIDAAIIAASNLYMSPEHLIDTGSFGTAHSPTALCHTFDVAADGYVKAEAVSTIIVKRLDDAIANRDPIRAIVLGTATTSNGRTPGIASPSASSQALAIATAYSNAGILDLNQTTYIECHGTGTQAGDPTEVGAIGSIFAATRSAEKPLLIGSIKSNIGHSEPAAGISGLLKVILSMENGFLPGTPTFINPNPRIDFIGNKVKAFRSRIPWPQDAPRRASINSFGVGGSNAHVIIERPDLATLTNHISSYISTDDGFDVAIDEAERPYLVVLSANNSDSLRSGIQSLGNHLINPRVKVRLSDLAYTLSGRRSTFWHRAFITTRNTELDDRPNGIPSVYLCSLHAMYHLGGLQEGQSVLIHSAAGGIGIACIELALHKKAEIFVTVGTEEKRQFLEQTYGISRTHMFSSRDARFATEIMKVTKGRGVNVVINSLVGELLDASWRILADGGNMVEIGKRDILDRNNLSMEPFDRNCSFRAIDMSYSRHVNDQMVSSLFGELFALFNASNIKPIHPITTFGFDNVVGALTHIRSGRHIGKIVISNSEQNDVQILIRPAMRRLHLDPKVSYVIVGGLRGACGTLAIHMAQHGARHIIVISRSGISDEASRRIVASCNLYNCDVTEARGDVGNKEFVRGVFKSAPRTIAGIIQGAMVLRDKPFETMTLDDYRIAIHAKVEGTKNLHQVSKETQNQPLQFFTMLSSISGIVGNKGQANYASANTFLDAFASYRHSLGLHANTVDLGVIEGVGYVAEQGSAIESRFDAHLWTPISESNLRKILTYSILQQNDNAPLNASSRAEMITGINYPLPSDASELASDSRFGYLFNSRADNNASTGEPSDVGDGDRVDQAIQRFRLLQKSGGDAPNLKATCLEVVSAQVVKTLRLETDPEVGRPLIAYGLDSLSAVELRNWIRTKLGIELTTLDINASSLVALSEKLISKIPCPNPNKK